VMCGRGRSPGGYEAALGLAWLGTAVGHGFLRLAKSEGVEAVWRASRPRLLQWGVGERALKEFELKRRGFDAAVATRAMQKAGLRFVPCGAPLYPAALSQLDLPPAGLFVVGQPEALERLATSPRAAVVGTRKASAEGLRATESFVRALCVRGVTIVSGMALGIDGRAHQAALSSGALTVAILGCGADVAYPRAHEWLYQRIAGRGLVVSELPPGTAPTRWTFPHRNRLLAALGDAVLVVEASVKSGALQTATCALDLGRPVFSVPGSIFVEGHSGCNLLLYEGAIPAVSPEVTAEDFLAQTRIERGERQACATVSAQTQERGSPAGGPADGTGGALQREGSRAVEVLAALARGPAGVDGLMALTGLSPRELNATLAGLELTGAVMRAGPGMYIRAP